jgi:glutamate dehydrogenase
MQPLYRRALLAHLPRMIRENPAYRLRIKNFPPKYRSAMLAVEIASTIVYQGGFERNFEEDLKGYVARMFA